MGKRKVQATFWGDSLAPSTPSKSDSVWLPKFFKPLPNHHFMANRWENNGNSDRLYFWGPKITANGDCSCEIKRCLLLGRKAMTKLDSILKSRDITLLTKDHLVKAMVSPVVLYGCELDYKES